MSHDLDGASFSDRQKRAADAKSALLAKLSTLLPGLEAEAPIQATVVSPDSAARRASGARPITTDTAP